MKRETKPERLKRVNAALFAKPHVVVDTSSYEFSHMKRPSGVGMWYFQIGDQTVTWTGSYSNCLKLAKAFAVEVRKVGTVVVLP